MSLQSIVNRFVTEYENNCTKQLRPMFEYMFQHPEKFNMKEEMVGVEIGTAVGYNAKHILETMNIKKLYLIDPYTTYQQRGKKVDGTKDRNKAHHRLKRWDDKVVWIEKYSSDAVNDVPGNLDFIYIDGNHDYEYVKSDVDLYYPKVKIEGIIGGDDFNAHYLGVVNAVMEFVKKEKLLLHGNGNDWWCIKE